MVYLRIKSFILLALVNICIECERDDLLATSKVTSFGNLSLIFDYVCCTETKPIRAIMNKCS